MRSFDSSPNISVDYGAALETYGRADELLEAMKGWVEKRRVAPGTMTPDAEELASQTPSVSELRQRKW